METLGFGDSGRIRKLLKSVEYNVRCVRCSRDVLCKIDPSLIENYDRTDNSNPSSRVQQAGAGSLTISFSGGEDVEFHTKRLVSHIFVHLKSVLDAVEESIRRIYWDQALIDTNDFYKKPTRSKLIASLSQTQSDLSVSEFIRRQLMPQKSLIRAMTFIRDEFIHNDYLVFNDLDRKSARQDAVSSYVFDDELVFDFGGARSDLFSEWAVSDREYKAFTSRCLDAVELIFNSFLTALLVDINAHDEVAIKFER